MASRQEASTESAPRRKTSHRQMGIKVTKTIRKPKEPVKQTPSAYLAEMRMNTEERLATITEMYSPTITELLDIATSSHQKDFCVSMDQALFQPFPSEVVFQQFQPHQTYEFPLNLRNNDRVARHLKVTHEDSPYFRAVCQRPAGSKVAPGMEVTYVIAFTPDEKKDYHLELVCITEREKFVVPVRAIGVRALLDFPDDIQFPSSPVKYSSTKTILVRNVGDAEANFTLHTESPYSVTPTSTGLKEGHCMQVTVAFLPLSVGDFSGELTVHYNTGESVYSSLHGSSVDVNVRLDRSSVTLGNTYIGLSTQRSVTLHNHSKVVVHYQWKAFSSEEEEEAQKQLQLQQLAEEEAMSKDVFLERCMHNPMLRDRMPLLTHSLAHRKRYVDMERFLFSDDNITIDPVEGDIWPNSQAEISIIFTPSEATSYSRVAYCDVTGRESRLPLRVKSQGVGPLLMFSFDTLDIQNVFINSAHAYEVILANKGDIEAGYKLLPLRSLFGPFFTFSPSSGVLQPGALHAIQISFRSTMLGEFSEDFQWRVTGSPSPLNLRVTGAVIGPTFQFDKSHINYGTISYGFLSSRAVVLTNTSEIPMTYRLRVAGSEREAEREEEGEEEGEGEGIEVGEFEVKPKSGVLPPNYHQNIQIDFVPAAVKVYSTELVLFVAEAGMEIFSLPISAKSDVPAITVETPFLDYGRCFLQYPSTLSVALTNPSQLPVKYEMQPSCDEKILHYSTDHPSGVIDPHTTLELPLQIEPQVVGEVITAALFRILGSTEDPLEVALRFVGEGPVINASLTELHWGRQPVLTPLPTTVYLSNESLIAAEFECVLSRERTVFSVEPPSGVIDPQGTLKLIVTATIDDCLRFTDKVTVVVSKGVNITISLSAEGEGTTIVSRPSLQPRVDLGPHFCSTWPCRKQFTLMNRGRRLQALSWTTQGFSAAKLKRMEIKRATQDVKDVGRKQRDRAALQEPELKKPVFRIIPDKCVLEPFEACIITLEGFSNEPHAVSERLVCHAIIGKNAHKERIMTVDVTANFIAPLTQFNTREISFTTYQPPGSELLQHVQSLSIQNVSPLPFTAVLMCIYPFSFKNIAGKLQQLELELDSAQKEEVVVQFDSAYCRDRRSRTENNQLVVAYKEHPLREYLSLKAEVYFPNLEFESSEVDFECILNDTETIRYVKMTNTSPLEVQYKWYFLRRPPVRRQDPEQCDEGVDMESECETDSLTTAEDEESCEEGEEEEEEEEDILDRQEGEYEEGEEGEEGEGGASERGDEEEEEEEWEEKKEERDPSQQSRESSEEKELEEETKKLEEYSGRHSMTTPVTDERSQSEGSQPVELLTEQGSDEPRVADTQDLTTSPAASIKDYSSESNARVGREKQPWELIDDPFTLVRIEQVFDILPLHGTLLPGESQQMQFTFYGYADIATECVAACKVEGGPTYQIRLIGEASNVQYKFNRKQIDFGQQLYGQVLTSELVLYNSGKVDMDFTAYGVSDCESVLVPGEISVQPTTGHIPALESMTLTIHFLPGVPEVFQKVFQIQVAHMQPDIITLVGEGVFPRIGLNLPSQLTEPNCTEYNSLRQRARENLISTVGSERLAENPSAILLQLEMERLLMKQFILDNPAEIQPSHIKRTKLRPSLPPYHLDFGYVVYGSVETRRVTLANTGSCPVSFNTAHKHLEGTGFSIDLVSKVRALPGGPDDAESLEFTVQFDPAAIQCPLGPVQALLPFNLFGGPVYSIRLSATVTKPSLQLSRSEIDFERVICGQCKVATVRISNPFHVRCCWSAVTNKPPQKIPKHVPMHVRRKMKDKPPPTYFEVDPPAGTIPAGQKTNIRIRFMPTEELDYEDTVPFVISQNPDSEVVLHVRGHGSEPHLEFDRQLVEFPAVLPFEDGSEAEVVVSNPLPHVIEMYSLECDKQYLEEEEILRWVKGYDARKRLFLPPVVPGGQLPKELLRAWEKAKPKSLPGAVPSEDELPSTVEGSGVDVDLLRLPSSAVDLPQRTPELSTTALLSVPELGVIESVVGLSTDVMESFSQINMDGVDVPPVAAAIAHYMGIDLSPEGAKNELRKGIAFMVDGPPMSGRTTLAKMLAKRYNAALINVDKLLKELISIAQTPEGQKLRRLCIEAEKERQAHEEATATVTAPTAGKKASTKDVKDKEVKDHAAKQDDFSLPVEPFAVLPLLDNADIAVPESILLPVPLSKELITGILENRILQQDCRQGVVFDGVESVFTSCPSEALRIILEAIHNRPHIYMAKVEMELTDIKERKLRLEKEAELRAQEEEMFKQQQKREEEERVRREMDIDEEDYEALSEGEKVAFDQKLLAVKKEKNMLKQREREERARLEREREEEERRIAEEMSKKKKGKGRKLPTAAAVASPSRPMSGIKPSVDPLGMASQASFASGMATPAKGKALKSPGVIEEHALVDPLEKKYSHHAHHSSAVETLLADWDRNARVDRPLPPEEPVESLTPVKKSNRKTSSLMVTKPQSPIPGPPVPEVNRDELGVPVIKLNGNKGMDELVEDILKTDDIPTPGEILEVLGLGPNGPPIAEPVTFQVYPFPLKRMKLMEQDQFVFIAASPDDPNAAKVEPPPPEIQPETMTESSASRKRSSDSRQSPLKQSRKKGSSKAPSPSPGPIPEETEKSAHKEKEEKKPSQPTKLACHRWVVPAEGQRKIKLLFSSKDCGRFDHTLNFEIVGTRQRYQLFCRGQCHVPDICHEPRTIFANCKKFSKENEIVHKRFVLSEGKYVFGPLHTSKNRERYKEGHHPENMERLTISNPGKTEAQVSFYFRDDADGTTYLLDPPTMTLNTGESQALTLWAFPRKCLTYDDALVCCVKYNPNPVVLPITCTGVEPELKFDNNKQLDFKKVLLHRKQTNVLTLTNPTLLPVAWKLGGLEQLGDEFSFNQVQGIVQPKSSFPLQVSFRAARPVIVSKKAIKVEVSDVEKYMGLMHIENITINAEAYDVAMDISFPRGADGGLDFQCVFAGSDQKLTMQLKNKGKYDIGFAFVFTKASNGKSYADMFRLAPQSSGALYPGEKSMSVNVTFHSTREVTIKDESILKCEVVDRHVGEQGEVIASIPIKITAKAVFSKFSLSPLSSVNFGAMVVNTKKQCTFTLENRGEFEFKYAIITDAPQKKPINKAGRGSRQAKDGGQDSSQASSLFKVEGGRGASKSRTEVASIRTEVISGTQRLVQGMFTIHPATGTIAAGQSTVITVDCAADRPGKQAVVLMIEIGDRSKEEPPIIYRIYGDVLEPAINATDLGSIFEEHGVCQSLGVMGPQLFHRKGCVGVYGETERRFAFKSVIVGQTAKARFKIINSTKIPCDAKLAIASASSKHNKSVADGFEVEPKSKITIPSHSHVFATVTFKPTAIQTYTATFEAYPEGYKQKTLSFELQGDGNLPQVEISHPSLKNAEGQTLLVFKRLLTDQSQTLRVSLRNVGTISAVVQIRTRSGKQHYTITIPDGAIIDYVTSGNREKQVHGKGSASPLLSMGLEVGETKDFLVTFCPVTANKCRGELNVRVQDNQFEILSIQLVGEGYQDDISIENIHGGADRELPMAEGKLQTGEIEALHENTLDFGDFPVGETRQISFSLTNRGSQPVKFQWPSSLPGLSFSPATGHLHPATSKDVCVRFKSDRPVTLMRELVPGKIWKIKFKDPLTKVADWDDRHKTVHWVTIPTSATAGDDKPLPSPAKKKVVEVETEPLHSALDDSRRELVLCVSATTDYVKYKCPTREIRFPDTLLYQTRTYKLPISNTGQIALSYRWSILHTDGSPVTPHSSQLHLDKDTGNVESEGGEVVPFSAAPSSGQIPAGRDAVISVHFSPLDVREWECKLVCSIPHLDSSNTPPEVRLHGKALMPYCHFELEPSDYFAGRPSGGGGGAVEGRETQFDPSSTRVIEFHSCGVGIKITKRFEVINPTISGYKFDWKYESRPISTVQPTPFKCLTPKGFVEPGRKFKMAFEFTPTAQEIVESLWQFSIPSLSQSFLLVGHTTEPAVLLDRAYVNFRSLKLGSTGKEMVYLINNESTEYSFDFVKKSCYSSGHMARVKINPLQGRVKAHSSLPVEVSFTASHPQEFNFNLECRVKRKPTPLRLNVKAGGYSIKMGLSFTSTSGEELELPLQSQANLGINFGKVPVNVRALGQIAISNRGDYNFQYRWNLSEQYTVAGARGCQLISVGQSEGTVEAHSRSLCELTFAPPKKMVLKDCTLTLEIVNGPTYPISIQGQGVEPKLVFSPPEVDFGMCFIHVHRIEMGPRTAKVVITNKDKDEISVKCLFESSPHFEIQSEQCLLKPGDTSDVTVTFRPTEVTSYQEKIEFEVNGLSTTSLTVKGEGVPMKVELADPTQKVLNLGALRKGEKVEKQVVIVNRSLIPVTLGVSLLPGSTTSHQLQDDGGALSVEPTDDVTLKAKSGTGRVTVKFAPKARISHFQEEVIMECGGMQQPLFIVTGSCLGQEIQLDMDHVPFGAVWQGSYSSRRILIINSGDIGASFKWETNKFAPDFSISPTGGYLSPGMEVPLDITFHPHKVSRDICYERLPCEIEGSATPLHLTLSGVCIEQTSSVKEALHFTTTVRSKEHRHLTIRNESNTMWRLTPIIDGQQWTGPDSISIQPNSAGHYELTYHPLTMTTENAKHHGSIFFPYPDGRGLLCNLLGTAEPPKITAQILREIPCKTPHIEPLTVENWARRPQRFRVIRELLRPDKLDQSVSLHGLDYIDIPALGKRDYKLNFYSFKECTILAKVTFMIEATGEYMFYHVTFKSTPSGIMDTIELRTQVRRSVSHRLTITNPLNSPVTFSTQTSVTDISLPSNFIVGPDSEMTRTFEYLPLQAGETRGKLTLSSSELGSYQYELHLTATPPSPEPPVHLTCHLGNSQQRPCKVPNYAKGARVEYNCKIRDTNDGDSTDFHVEKSVTASGTEVVVEVTFEPSRLGDTQATLFLSSHVGGDYAIPLHGHCLPPRPEGPYTVKAGQTIGIPFKNVFPQTMQFSYTCNNPTFSVKAAETLKARKTCNMQVTYDAKQADPHQPRTGKLVVTSQRSARSGGPSRRQQPPPISWVYYLKGVAAS